jgi:hypothetical protein
MNAIGSRETAETAADFFIRNAAFSASSAFNVAHLTNVNGINANVSPGRNIP